MRITELTDKDRPAWDRYVAHSAYGLPQHLSGWRDVLSKTYGFDTCYCMAQYDGAPGSAHQPEVAGILPLYVIRSPLVGRIVTTMPGGLCANDDTIAAELIAKGVALAQEVKAKQFILHDTRRAWPGDMETTSHHENWIVDVRMGHDALWTLLDRNIRRQVRMAQRNGLSAVVDRTGDRLDDFYYVLSHFTHQAGTPVFGRDFLENVIESFANEFNIVVVYRDEQPIGGYFQLEMGNTVYGAWGATLHAYLELRPVYLAYWEIFADTISQGFEFLDMGRSPADSNASKYKSQWTGFALPVYQQVVCLGNRHSSASIATRTQSDAKLLTVRRMWPKLPFPIAQFLGPKLRRHVPFA